MKDEVKQSSPPPAVAQLPLVRGKGRLLFCFHTVQVGDILMLVSGAARFQVPDSRSLFRGVRKILLAGAPISLGAPSHTFLLRELITL